MAIEDPVCAFVNDPRHNEIEKIIDDTHVGDLRTSSPSIYCDGPEDLAEWIKDDNYDGEYDYLTTILSVIEQYLDNCSCDDIEFEQEDLDELLEYAKNTPIKVFYPER